MLKMLENAFRSCAAQERSQFTVLGLEYCIRMTHMLGECRRHWWSWSGQVWVEVFGKALVKQGSVVFFLAETNET
jgi:hypothetical protein